MSDGFHGIDEPDFDRDLIMGAPAISTWLWGTPDKVRKVYHLAETSNTLPIVRMGSVLTLRKSVARAKFWAQERRVFDGEKEEELVRLGVLLARLSAMLEPEAGRDVSAPTDPGQLRLWMLVLQETLRTIDQVLKSD